MQEGRKKIRRKLCSCLPAFLYLISNFEQDFVPGSKRGAAEGAKGIAEMLSPRKKNCCGAGFGAAGSGSTAAMVPTRPRPIALTRMKDFTA